MVDWIINHSNSQNDFLSVVKSDSFDLADALTICDLLFFMGFIVSVDRHPKFIQLNSHYIFQAPFFLPNGMGSPSHRDYARYLLRRSYMASTKYKLHQWELANLDRLREILQAQWEPIEEEVVKDMSFIDKQKKQSARIFKLQENTYWRVNRATVIIKRELKLA